MQVLIVITGTVPPARQRSVIGIQDSHESGTMRSSANEMSLLSPKAILVLISCLQANQLWGGGGEKLHAYSMCTASIYGTPGREIIDV